MSARTKIIALLALFALALARPAFSFGIGHLGSNFGSLGAIGQGSAPVVQPTGDILLTDGTSLILQTDGASLICRAGGC